MPHIIYQTQNNGVAVLVVPEGTDVATMMGVTPWREIAALPAEPQEQWQWTATGPLGLAAPIPAALNKTQWSFLLDVTGFRAAVDGALAALPKGTAQELAQWAGMNAGAYESPEFTQHVTLVLAAQIRAMGIPGLSIPTDAEIVAAWPIAEAFQGAASLGVV